MPEITKVSSKAKMALIDLTAGVPCQCEALSKGRVLFLLGKHTGFTCVFFFYPNKSILNSGGNLYKKVTLNVYPL